MIGNEKSKDFARLNVWELPVKTKSYSFLLTEFIIEDQIPEVTEDLVIEVVKLSLVCKICQTS